MEEKLRSKTFTYNKVSFGKFSSGVESHEKKKGGGGGGRVHREVLKNSYALSINSLLSFLTPEGPYCMHILLASQLYKYIISINVHQLCKHCKRGAASAFIMV